MQGECNPSPECKYFDAEIGCHASTHHLSWPAKDYKHPIDKAFRELPANKEEICRAYHDELHAENPPFKPDRNAMLEAIKAEKSRRNGRI